MNNDTYRLLTQDQITEVLSIATDPSNKPVTRTLINDWFSPQVFTNESGKTIVGKPKFYVHDTFDLPANTLKNNKTEIKETTVGIFLFNFFILSECFGARILYINDTLTKKRYSQLEKEIDNNILTNQIDTEQYAKFSKRIVWISYFTELFMPGLTYNLIKPNEEVLKMKKKLIAENPEIVKNNDAVAYHNKIEKPLLQKAEEILKEDPGWNIFELGTKPSFSNNYKNSCITNGALYDPINKTRVINTNAYAEGLPLKSYDILGNKALKGSYDRSVDTQYGGALTKVITPSLSAVVLDEHGSDCGTKRYRTVKLTKDNIDSYKLCYMVEKGELKLLTFDIIKDYLGKTVEMRTPLYCKSKKMCNKCFGELAYIQEFFNAGSLASRTTASIMYSSMKSMHNITVSTAKIDLSKYTKFK